MQCNNRFAFRALSFAVLLIALPGSVIAVEEPTITAHSARVSGLGGGTSAAYGDSFEAMYLNPVALAEGTFSLTALESTLWLRSSPEAALPLSARFVAGPNSDYALGSDQVAQELREGIGFGAAAGLGATGGGFGLSLRAAADSFSYGSTVGTSETLVEAEIGFVGGVALPFRVGGITLTPGLDVRPFVRVHGSAQGENSASILARYLGLSSDVSGSHFRSSLLVLNGYGVSMNTGLRVDFGPAFLSGVLRDVGGTPLRYSWHDAGTVIDSLAQFGLPVPADSNESGYIEPGTYSIPMRLSIGIGFQRELGQWGRLLAYAEVADAFALDYRSHSTLLAGAERLAREGQAGAELGVGRILSLRGGINRGRPTAGAGLELGPWELDAAYSAGSLLSSEPRASVPQIWLSSSIAF